MRDSNFVVTPYKKSATCIQYKLRFCYESSVCARKNADHPGPRYPQPSHSKVLNTDIIQVLQTLAKSANNLGATMDAVETPIQTPGWVQAPNPLLSVITAPFNFRPERPGAQPSVSVSSASTAYIPAGCSATVPTAICYESSVCVCA